MESDKSGSEVARPRQQKRYIAGPSEKLRELFPTYAGNDERTMPDGNLLIEVNLDDFKLASMEVDPNLTVMTHEEALKYVREFEPPEAIRAAAAEEPEDE